MIKRFVTSALLCFAASVGANPQHLSSDAKLACEAIMCLSQPGNMPHECEPAIKRYQEIRRRKAADTESARQDFLRQCPRDGTGKQDDK